MKSKSGMPRLGSVSFVSIYPCESGNRTLPFLIQSQEEKVLFTFTHTHTRLNHVDNIIKRKRKT